MKTFAELRKISVIEKMKKKGRFNYLSWAYAVDVLLQEDKDANWEFKPHQMYGETMMVFCSVTAFGATRTAFLPVMDNNNKAVINPDANQVNKAMQRCLVKAIALHGIALYIYEGEDLPEEGEPEAIDLEPLVIAIHEAADMDALKKAYIAGIKACDKNQDAKKVLESAKDSRKIELSQAKHEATTNAE